MITINKINKINENKKALYQLLLKTEDSARRAQDKYDEATKMVETLKNIIMSINELTED